MPKRYEKQLLIPEIFGLGMHGCQKRCEILFIDVPGYYHSGIDIIDA
jgi:hypothetical protein